MRLISFIYFMLWLSWTSKMSAQSYVPFPDSNAIWTFITNDDIPEYYCLGITNADTMLSDGKLYHKLYWSRDSVFEEKELYGAIRQDIALKRIYFREIQFIDTSFQSILYDFSLHIGDTLFNANGYYTVYGNADQFSPAIYLTMMDSILIQNSYRKRFRFSYPYTTVVEGIGNVDAFLLHIMDLISNNGPTQFKCFQKDGKWVYPADANCDKCFGLNSGVSSINNDLQFQIFPNPVDLGDGLNISTRENIEKIQIVSIEGKTVHMSLHQEKKTLIDTRTVSPGFYYVKLICHNSLTTRKLIVR